MSKPVLHYIYDPLCGWCYAAEPLIDVLQTLGAFELVMHGGGLMRGNRIAPAMHQHIVESDRRINHLSGQPFGDAYLNGLLRDSEAVHDSLPPINAIRTVAALGSDPFLMQKAIQHARYVEGRDLSRLDTLVKLAEDLGLDAESFRMTYAQQSESIQTHIGNTQQMLDANGGGGFPTLLLEEEVGLRRLEISTFYGEPESWRAFLTGLLPD